MRATVKQLEHAAAAATDVEKIADGCRNGQVEDRAMDGTIDTLVLPRQHFIVDDFSAQLPQTQPITPERVVLQWHQAEQLAGSSARPPRQGVEHAFPIAESRQQAGVAELLQVLGRAGLAQSDDLGQLRDTALPLGAQRNQAHAHVVAKRAQLQ
jgi:hypothetical protein